MLTLDSGHCTCATHHTTRVYKNVWRYKKSEVPMWHHCGASKKVRCAVVFEKIGDDEEGAESKMPLFTKTEKPISTAELNLMPTRKYKNGIRYISVCILEFIVIG